MPRSLQSPCLQLVAQARSRWRLLGRVAGAREGGEMSSGGCAEAWADGMAGEMAGMVNGRPGDVCPSFLR